MHPAQHELSTPQQSSRILLTLRHLNSHSSIRLLRNFSPDKQARAAHMCPQPQTLTHLCLKSMWGWPPKTSIAFYWPMAAILKMEFLISQCHVYPIFAHRLCSHFQYIYYSQKEAHGTNYITGKEQVHGITDSWNRWCRWWGDYTCQWYDFPNSQWFKLNCFSI
jgi:hypothetical protein